MPQEYKPIVPSNGYVVIDNVGRMIWSSIAYSESHAKQKAVNTSWSAGRWSELEEMGYKVELIYICKKTEL